MRVMLPYEAKCISKISVEYNVNTYVLPGTREFGTTAKGYTTPSTTSEALNEFVSGVLVILGSDKEGSSTPQYAV